jgi:hypothetical protein
MYVIEAIIVRHQSAQEMIFSNKIRKTVAISLGAASSLTDNDEGYAFFVASRKQVTIAEQPHRQQGTHVLHRVIKGYDNGSDN